MEKVVTKLRFGISPSKSTRQIKGENDDIMIHVQGHLIRVIMMAHLDSSEN